MHHRNTIASICFFLLFLIFATPFVHAQTAGLDQSVLLFAEPTNSPPSIKLRWYLTVNCQGFNILRKLKSETTFVPIVSNLPSSPGRWVDTNVQVGVEYEYQIVRYGGTGPWGGSTGWGYISAGIKVNPPDFRGKIILLTDSITAFNPVMKSPIWQWTQDAEGDGWQVLPLIVSATATPAQVKQKIVALNAQHQSTVRSIFILGHVPIPYSGLIAPDGHLDHDGAWPADGYYGELNGGWSDASVNQSSAADSRNWNVPGDGKFDQSTFPGMVELEVGRLDLRNLTMFGVGEDTLLVRYLAKNHKFKTHQIKVTDRPMHDDQATGLTFGATAWRNYTALCRNNNIPTNNYSDVCTGNFRTVLTQNDYLWSGSWGAGSYTSVGTNQAISFVIDSFRTVFTSFIGSYFGDWDSPANNFMRSALCNRGPILTTCWSGRPFWYFHHMGMGEPIGYAAKLTMNNSDVYQVGSRPRQVHIALLGDPTLRLHPIGQVTNMQTNLVNGKVQVSWSPPNDTLLGYNILRKSPGQGWFQRINSNLITGISFVDSCPASGQNIYMVRVARWEGSRTGTYWNQSLGVMDTILYLPTNIPSVQIQSLPQIVCETDTLRLLTSIQNPTSSIDYQWFKNDTLLVGDTSYSLLVQNPASLDQYRVRIVSTTSCGNVDTAFSNLETLQVTPSVLPSVLISSAQFPGEICEGTPVQFSAAGSGDGSNPVFTWFVNQDEIAGQTDPSFTSMALQNLDTVRVKLNSNADCAYPKEVYSNVLVAHVNPNPVAGFAVSHANLSAQPTAGLQFQWLLNGQPISGAVDSVYTALVDGNYALIVNNLYLCSDTSATVFVTLTGTKNSLVGPDFKCYPNPAEELLFVDWQSRENLPQSLEITDLMGRRMFALDRQQLSCSPILIQTQNWPSGSYIINMAGNRASTNRLILRK